MISVVLIGCKKDSPESTEETINYDPTINTSQFINYDLGRVLFYDRQLSVNNEISCGSCHKQSLAFSDDVDFSKGFKELHTLRNSPPIQNLGQTQSHQSSFFFWDGRETDLEEMVLKPITNEIEMGMESVEKLAAKLQELPYYPALFEKRFGKSGFK